MHSPFAVWQRRYGDGGVPTFPVQGEKPAVRENLKIGLHGSAAPAAKYPPIEAFGVEVGDRHRISILDIDTGDAGVLEDAFATYGEPPFIVRIGSGRYQTRYRNNGEVRAGRYRGVDRNAWVAAHAVLALAFSA